MKKLAICGLLALLAISGPSLLRAQQNGYAQSNVVANSSGVAANTDSQLSNPWGIAFVSDGYFWVANNNGGTSTFYTAQGVKNSLVVNIPVASVNPCSPGCPTGIVANTSTDFNSSNFIFDSEDGILASWVSGNNATIAFDNSASGAVYKGLALVTNGSGNFLLAANFNSGKIDVFDRNFQLTALAGSFTDPNLPAGYAPHGVHIVNGQVYVAYAVQDGAKHDPTLGAGMGIVDIFDLNGNFVKTFASAGTLNAPWGVVATPATFGTFSSDILIGNFGDGTINAFDSTGKFLGQVSDTNNKPIVNAGLWDMVFGANGTGGPSTMYLTAGGANQTTGLFATLVPASASTNANFSLSLSSQSLSVTQGQSGTLSIGASAVGGFNSPIALTCTNPPAGVTCSFSPASITPGSSAASSTLTVSTATTVPPTGYTVSGMMSWLPLSSLGLFGMVFANRRKPLSKVAKRILCAVAISVLALATLFTVGCGGGSTSSSSPKASTSVTVMVTGTSGAISHSVPVTVTIR